MTSKPPNPAPARAGADVFGAALRHHQSGRLAEAEALYRQILARDPSHVGSLHLLGLVAHQTGRNEDAAQLIGRALSLEGATPDCHYHMGLVQSARGQLDAAATHLAKAAELKPDHAEAHMDLGTVLKRQGRPDAALASYRRALALRPDAAQIRYNLANLLAEQGRLDEAVGEYQQALRLMPKAAPIHHNLAAALLAQNNLIGAVAEYQEALRCDPHLTDAGRNIGRVIDRIVAAAHGGGMAAKMLFALTVENLTIIPDEVDLRGPLIEALTEPWGRPSDLLGVAKAVLRKNTAIRGAIERARESWPTRLAATQMFANSDRAAVTGDTLLCCLLQSTRVSDIGFERLLTTLRAIALEKAITGEADDDADQLAFSAALAQQCYLNDYVYDLADGERTRAEALRERLAAALRAGEPIPPSWIVAVASYFPLRAIPDGERLLARSWPPPVAALFAQQIAQPAEEMRLRKTIPRLTPIEDRISLDVQRQYAENPYPNWGRLPLTDRPMTIDEHLAAMFPHLPFRKIGKAAADMLIAGCGTGQQALDAANLFAAARLLAIDLSLPSLAFAKRKARELGIGNIEFAQADILGLGGLDRTFDSIEAMGVLHHLADPWAGWSVLLGRLVPGGVMRIGLYSALAHQDIVRGRKIVAERGYRATADDIRRARQELIAIAAEQQLLFVRDSWDFFSISECRDLLFHVQEHRMTLPQIKTFLVAQNLQFLGFELADPLWRAYGARFPDDTTRTDLDYWHQFETENPRTFQGMYQFWVQKPAT